MRERDGAVASAAMVLAAGYGTRLGPLTGRRAKAVVPFLNRPLLDYSLDWLRRSGFRKVIVNLHHAPGSVRRLYGQGALGVHLRYSLEKELLGTAGGPRAMLEELGERALLVNGDVACNLPLGPLRAHHEAASCLATLALHTGPAAAAHPSVAVDQDGRILEFPDGATSAGSGRGGCFAGVHLVERRVLELVPPGRCCGIVDPVYRELVAAELAVHGVPLPGSWYEAGSVEGYRDSQLAALAAEEFPLAFQGYRREGPGAYRRASAQVGRAGLEPPYLLGEEVRVEHGARLRGVVAGAGVRVASGARVSDSVLLDGASVGTGATLRRMVVMEGCRVPPGTMAEGALWAAEGPWDGTPAGRGDRAG